MIECTSMYDGQVEHILLAHGKGNILDKDMVGALRHRISTLNHSSLKLIVFEGRGRHFSFGASVEEHLPEFVQKMLSDFHALFYELEALGIPTLALVRGCCFGGGFELATWCGRVLVSPEAKLAIPEIKLGVFPPIASLGLFWRVGGARGTDLVLTGRTLSAQEALDIGLVEECVEDLDTAWKKWFEKNIQPRSAPALRFAWKASRLHLQRRLLEDLPELERIYLEELMAFEDPVEGMTAFIERREPKWRNL